MGIVVSLLLVAVGAVMRYAVSVEGSGWNVGTVGMILMIVGAVGAALSIAYWASWGGFGRRAPAAAAVPAQRTTTVRETDVR